MPKMILRWLLWQIKYWGHLVISRCELCMITVINLQKLYKSEKLWHMLGLILMRRTTDFEGFFDSVFLWKVKWADVFFRYRLFLYSLCSKGTDWTSLSASQVVFEVVTSGHPGYVAIDEVKVLGHPCSKYLSAVLKPAPRTSVPLRFRNCGARDAGNVRKQCHCYKYPLSTYRVFWNLSSAPSWL